MPDPFFGVESGLRALRTAQAAMNTTSHNIANVNTPGYSRQRVEYQVTDPYTVPSQWYKIGALQQGTGVQARSITQARDNALDVQVWAGYSDRESPVAQHGALAQIEEAIGEPGANGINAALTRLFNSFHDLANNAESTPLRSGVLAGAGSVTSTFQQVYQRLENVEQGIATRIEFGVAEINDTARQIATLNQEIRKVLAQGDQPNDLRDRRNSLIDGLSKKANTTVLPAADGTLTVQIGGVALVRGTQAYPIAGVADLTANNDLNSGEMKGLLLAQTRITQSKTQLDAVAVAFMNQVNTLHQAGLDKAGTAGLALFTGTGARDIVVNPLVAGSPDKIAAAGGPASTFAVGNGDNALALADLATKKITSGPITNQTLRDYWGGTAATLGVDVKALQTSINSQDAFVGQLEARRESISGVSLDDEMADMVRFQRAYQAAAKLISISDEMTATLLNAFGG